MWRDWNWIRARMNRINRDKREERLWLLNSLGASMQLMSGNADMYNGLLDMCFTPEEQALRDKARKDKLKAEGRLLQPRRAGEKAGTELRRRPAYGDGLEPQRQVQANTPDEIEVYGVEVLSIRKRHRWGFRKRKVKQRK